MRINTVVYTPLPPDGYELCHPVSMSDFEVINEKVNGTPLRTGWTPLSMRVIRKDEGRELMVADSPWLGSHALIFRPRAVEALRPLLWENGELLPLTCSEKVLMYNATRVVDALDEEASSLLRFSGGRIMMIKKHVFREDAVVDLDIFKIPNLRASSTFVSQRFVDQWKACNLRGLDFRPVWDSQDKDSFPRRSLRRS
jgi:hypothetical protein